MAKRTQSCGSTERPASLLSPPLLLLALAAGSGTASVAHAQDTNAPRESPARELPERPATSDEEGPDWRVGLAAEGLLGYDTDPAAGVAPDQRRVPQTPEPPTDPPDPGMSPDEQVGGSPFAQLGARLLATVGREWWGRSRLGWDYRQYFDGELRSQGWLALEGGWRSPSWTTRMTVEVMRYDDTLAPMNVDGWVVRTDLGTVRWLGDFGLLGAHVELATRRYDDDVPHDALVGAGPYGGFIRGGWQLAAGVDTQRRWSDARTVTRTEIVPWASLAYRHAGLELEARYETYVRRFVEGDIDGAEHRLRVRADVQPWDPPIALVAGMEYGRARGQDSAITFDRVVVFGGLAVELGWQADKPSHLEAPPPAQGPATVTARGVRFRVHRPQAGSVAVIGTFNDWDPERGALEPVGDGWFEGTFEPPSGRHQYQLLVDGKAQRPEGAESYAPDGFGGENAILLVP